MSLSNVSRSLALNTRPSAGWNGWMRQAVEMRALGRLAAPMMLTGILNMILSLTDTAMMGWLDPLALAGGVLVSDFYSFAFYFAASAVSAVAPLAASAIGARSTVRAGVIVGQGLWVILMLGAAGYMLVSNVVPLLSIIGVAVPRPEATAHYAHMMGATFALMLLFAWGRSALAALGCARISMLILIAALPLNAVGNHVLMYGAFGFPEMGLAGAGASSVLVALFAGSTTVAYLLAAPRLREYRVARGALRPDPAMLVELVRTGMMIAVASVAETGVFLLSTIVVGLVDPQSLAAHAIVFRSLGLGYSITIGFGQAVTIKIAKAHGATNARAARRVTDVAGHVAMIAAGVIVVVYLGTSRLAGFALAAEDEAGRILLADVQTLLPLTGASLAALVISSTMFAVLRGHADVRTPALLALAGYWVIGFGTMALLTGGAGLGATGIWIALIAGPVAAALGCALYMGRVVTAGASTLHGAFSSGRG
jgi:multidrug resistance protein, MATE family